MGGWYSGGWRLYTPAPVFTWMDRMHRIGGFLFVVSLSNHPHPSSSLRRRDLATLSSG